MKGRADGPRVVLLGGLEPSGRAGLLADVETAASLGASAWAVATALTAQSERVFASRAVSAQLIGRQLKALLELGPVLAVKLGMVPDRAVLGAIRRGLAEGPAPWVVDPVVRSSQGRRLSRLTRADYLGLAGPSVVLTPNLEEAAWLSGAARPLQHPEQAAQAGAILLQEGFAAVVIKGGHSKQAPVEVVCTPRGTTLLEGRRLPRVGLQRRGTGCRFATALAVSLAQGGSIPEAARAAKAFVRSYLGG